MPTDTASSCFRKMAERIDHNADSRFGGAAVIVPPQQGGDVIELLILDEKGDPAQFWGTILTRAQLEVGRIEGQKQLQHAFQSR